MEFGETTARTTIKFRGNRYRRGWKACGVMILFSALPAYADILIPFWIGEFLFVIASSIFVGMIEGILVTLVRRKRFVQNLMVMMIANLFSSIAGLWPIVIVEDWHGAVSLENCYFFSLLLFFTCYALSIVVEWPFVLFLFRKYLFRFRFSLFVSFFTHTITYAVFLVHSLYFGALGVSNVTLVPLESIDTKLDFSVFYAGNNHNVYRYDSIGKTTPEMVNLGEHTGVYFRIMEGSSPSRLGLYSWDELLCDVGDKEKTIYKNFEPDKYYGAGISVVNLTGQFDTGHSIVPSDTLDWNVNRMSFYCGAYDKWIRIGGTGLFCAGSCNKITYLPENFTIMQFDTLLIIPNVEVSEQHGRTFFHRIIPSRENDICSHICLLDESTGKMAVLGRGSSPIVVLHKQ